MSQRVGSRGDWGKAPVYTPSHGDDSFDDDIASAGEQAARVFQSHFDHGGDDDSDDDDDAN